MQNHSGGGLATVLFTDVEGSTDLRTRRGDEWAHRELNTCLELIDQEIQHHGGHVVKSLGDGLLAWFESPRRAVTCAASIQREVRLLNRARADEPLTVRVGINTGEVVRQDGDVYGEAVNAASRISELARGGQTLVSSIVKDLVGTLSGIAFSDAGSHSLKGFQSEWRLYEIVGEEREQPLFAVKTPFVGRQAELSQLRTFLERSQRGRGAVVMIGGEPGVGKSRLAEELGTEARNSGFIAFTGHCYETEAGVPYMPFVEILQATAALIPPETFREIIGDSASELARFFPDLKAMFPDISEPIDIPAEQERRYAFNSIARYMRRAAALRPVMLVLEDLHWGDESTLLLLEHLTLNLQDIPVLIVGTYRDVELAASRPLARTLEQLLRQRLAHRMNLKRLSRNDVAAMLHRLSGSEAPAPLVDAIYAETEGNAFFVEEIFRHLVEEGRLLDEEGAWRPGLEIGEVDVPESVRLVIGRRLERLGEKTRAALTAAAVIGRVFDFDLLDGLGDVTGDDLLDAMDEAERARLIIPVGDGRETRYTFGHELVRQTLLADVSLPRRQRLHLKVADSLERVHSVEIDKHIPDLAHHLYQAGVAADPEKTVDYLIRAGDLAMSIAASEDALRNYEIALSLGGARDARRARILYKIGRARRGLRQWDAAVTAWQEALEISEALGLRDQVARTCLLMADRHTWAGEWQRAIDILQRGLDAYVDERDVFRGSLLALQAVAYAWAGDYSSSSDRLSRATELANEIGDPRLLVGVMSAKALHHWCFAQFRETIETSLGVADILRGAAAPWALATILSYLQFSYAVTGQWDESEDLYAELWPLANRLGHPSALLFCARWHESMHFMQTADFDRARVAANNDLEFGHETQSPWVAEAYSWLGSLEFLSGDWGEARRYFEEGARHANRGAFHGSHAGVLVINLAYAGARAEALELLEELEPDLTRTGVPRTIGSRNLASHAAEAMAVLGEWDRVAALHGAVVEQINDGARWRGWSMTPLADIAAMTAFASGLREEAEGHFARALEIAERNGAVFVGAHSRELYALALMELGSADDVRRAATLLEEAIPIYERSGLTPWVRVATEMLDRARQNDSGKGRGDG